MNELSFPEVIAKEEIYRGKVFDVTLETIREGERTYQREARQSQRECGYCSCF
jgi:hypothetical protein